MMEGAPRFPSSRHGYGLRWEGMVAGRTRLLSRLLLYHHGFGNRGPELFLSSVSDALIHELVI